MANGIIKEVTVKQYYDYKDVMEILGVSRSKAYNMIDGMREECIEQGRLTRTYPPGKIPRKYFNEVCMIE